MKVAVFYLDDKNCKECFFMPIYSGGCPDERLKRPDNLEKFCTIAKYSLQEFLELHYKFL